MGLVKKIIEVNGIERTLIVDQEALLSDVLRKQLHLTGTKVGCGSGMCGACNVIMDDKLVRSCVVRMKRVENWQRSPPSKVSGPP
jgi:aldehyde oxidoreductase